jgi:hypothetical protein
MGKGTQETTHLASAAILNHEPSMTSQREIFEDLFGQDIGASS